MIKLLLVDDKDTFRSSLANILSLESDLEVIGEASNGTEAIAFVDKHQPDVILMDVRMPVCDGITATREIIQRYPWMKIMVLTTFNDDEYISQSIQLGAKGYLLKRKSGREMATAIRSVNEGYIQLSPESAPKAFSGLKPKKPEDNPLVEILHPREIEILRLIGQGKNNTEISDVLFLSSGTVRNYITQIFKKLDLRDRVVAALWAKENLEN